jgi:hypothetical protein
VSEAGAIEVALDFVAKINAHDVDAIVALMSPDHVFIDGLGATFRGAEQMRAGWKFYLGMFPDYAIEVTSQFDRGDSVALFGKARGTFAVNGKLSREWPQTLPQNPNKIQSLTAADEVDDLEGIVRLDLRF